MSRKTKTITLAFPVINRDPTFDMSKPGGEHHIYMVMRVTDSVEYAPGQQLLRKQVEELCAAADWKVTIVAPA